MRKKNVVQLSRTQEAALIKLFNSPDHEGYPAWGEKTGAALHRKGYATRLGTIHSTRPYKYRLTQAGIRYNQTGKLIGE